MSISLPWAIALAVAAAMAGVLILAIAAHRGVVAVPERGLAHIAHLLGGGLAGFMALAFPPVWPVLAFVLGMLVVQAMWMRRILDIGLLAVGFGSAWTLLLGIGIVNDLTDPAVASLGDSTGWFVFGIGLLLAGLTVTVASSMAPAAGRRNPEN